ncbi:MAG: ribulose-phosphate 3-epimerase [Gemmatimonadota bacterium]
MILLAPSILSADFGRLAEQVQEVERAGADWIHVDVMDGHFVPNLTIGPVVTEAVKRATRLPVDVHLMIEHPDRYLADFVGAGADRITVHREACPHLHRTLSEIARLGVPAGVALNPATPLSSVGDVVGDLELLLVMTVNPGFGGQRFIRSMLPKIQEASRLLAGSGRPEAVLQVDGGVDPLTAPEVADAGAQVLVAGSAVYGHPDGATAGLRALRDALGARA